MLWGLFVRTLIPSMRAPSFPRGLAAAPLREYHLNIGEFSTFDKPRTPPAVCNQSLDWSKHRPDRDNQIGQIPREWQSHASINL